jgi:hypothetical protein
MMNSAHAVFGRRPSTASLAQQRGHDGLGVTVPPGEARGKGGGHTGQGEEAAELTM